MNTLIPRTLLAGALAALLLVGGCTSGDDPGESTDAAAAGAGTDDTGTVLQPGRPGEPNRTVSPETTIESAPTTAADVTFMQLMIPHHHQALEMCELARTRARDERVASLARRIHGAQGPEILAMSAWLSSRGLEVPEPHRDHSGHDHSEMAGMLDQQQMDELAAARGRAFDRLFLAGMTQHHRGAVTMAHDALDAGSDTLALELAADIATGQLAEIQRMADLRRSL